MEPLRDARAGVSAWTASTFTLTWSPAPEIFTKPALFPFGALLQSTLTHKRCSLSMVPCVALKEIHDACELAVNEYEVRPRSKTSMYRRCLLNASNSGRIGAP